MSDAPAPQIPILDEYKLCDERTSRLEGYVWQTASLLGIASILGLITTGRDLAASPHSAALPSALGSVFGIVAALVWWRFARRWWSIQHLMFERMREIE